MISSSSTTRDLPISAEEVTEDFAGAMETLTPSTVTSNLSIQQPKIEIDLCSQDDLNLLPFQQLETQLLDSMEIAEQQSSKSQLLEGDYIFLFRFILFGCYLGWKMISNVLVQCFDSNSFEGRY